MKNKLNTKNLTILGLIMLVSCLGGGGGGSNSDQTNNTGDGDSSSLVDKKQVLVSGCMDANCNDRSLYSINVEDYSLTRLTGPDVDVSIGSINSTVILNSKFYFTASDTTHGRELWVYDPALAIASGQNPKILADINQGSSNSNPYNFYESQGIIYFFANDGSVGYELFKFDPASPVSSSNPAAIYDLRPGTNAAGGEVLTTLNGKIVYTGHNSSSDPGRLYEYDPSLPAGPTNPRYVNVLNSSDGFYFDDLVKVGSTLFFSGDGDDGKELWQLDTTQSLTGSNPSQVVDLYNGTLDAVWDLRVANSKIYFKCRLNTTGVESCVYDPALPISSSNPELLADTNPGSGGGGFETWSRRLKPL